MISTHFEYLLTYLFIIFTHLNINNPMKPESLLQTALSTAVEAGEAIMKIYTHPDLDWQVERKADNSPLTLADRRSHAVIAQALDMTPFPVLSEEGCHEDYSIRQAWHTLWIVDPLDGTKEFLKRNGEFTVNIALVKDGHPVMGVIYVPVSRTLFWGHTEEFNGQKAAWRCEVNSDGNLVNTTSLPVEEQEERPFIVVASRSHLSPETEAFVARERENHPDLELHSAGSSLKICLVAEGRADVYPRLAPTMEWDTAAGHAIALGAGCEVVKAEDETPVVYNKENLLNPYFIVRPASTQQKLSRCSE